MIDKVDGYVRRPVRYKNIDGAWEMSLGLLWLGVALLDYLHPKVAGKFTWHWKATHLLCFGVLVSVVLYGRKVLKERITYRRTGFVKYRGLEGKPWVVRVIAGALAIPATIFSVFLWRHFTFSVMVALISSMWGFLYAFATKLDGAYRWVVLVVMVAGPVAISTLPLDRLWLETLPLGFLGLTFFVSGVITLYLYLRRTRLLEEAAE
jgi:hypothetical protein